MGIHVQCPACGTHASDTVSPDARWGTLYDEKELENAVVEAESSAETYLLLDEDGRRAFECPCGRAVWIADRKKSGQPSTGRWFMSPGD